MQRTGAEIIWEALGQEGVDVVFGYPGGAILPAYDAMTRYPHIHHVLVRHEQGATHMADGYARATGKVGVAIATSGPGATNMVTGLATALMDSSPIVCITGQVPTAAIGSDAFQETDVTGVTLPVTKHNYLVTDVRDLAQTIHEAFHLARTGRPGPVLIDIPKDVQNAKCDYEPFTGEIRLRGYRPSSGLDADQMHQALDLIRHARRPIILAGHGVMMASAERELMEFAEQARVPVAQTLLGIGNFPASHPLCLGMMGMHGEAFVNQAIQEADLLLAFGMRFDDRVTGNLKTYARNARKIHVDIDASEIGKIVEVDVGIVGDLKAVLRTLNPHLMPCDSSEWMEQIDEWRDDTRIRDIVSWDGGGKLYAAHVLHDLWKETNGEAIVVTDVGQHQMWEAQYYRHERPRTLITSGGLGTMGFALPAAIGATFGCPDAEVWAVAGDGGFQMTLCELATVMQERRPVKIAIINNAFLGMVRQWQEFFYEERYAATPMWSPDFIKLADAYGMPALRVTQRDEIPGAVAAAQATEGPFLIEFVVEKDEIVYPMVPAGADLDKMIRRPASTQMR
ncbi:MAG TPA: biosynthetic-type acetolactate synthase large subunit [Ardenticatenaceae bacterium]|jgi:acetolactate synthase-1/2/3 large subunit